MQTLWQRDTGDVAALTEHFGVNLRHRFAIAADGDGGRDVHLAARTNILYHAVGCGLCIVGIEYEVTLYHRGVISGVFTQAGRDGQIVLYSEIEPVVA